MKNTEQKIPALRFPEFEGEWVEKRLGEIASLGSSKRVYLSDYVDNGIPFYRGKEITELKANKKPSDILYISEELYENFKREFGIPKEGDILITAVGTLANVWLVDNHKFYFKDGNLIWLSNLKTNSHFSALILERERKNIEKTAIGSSQKALTMVELNKIVLPFPTLTEQQKIADFLSAVDKRLQTLKDKKTKLEEYKRGVMQRIFSQELRFTRPDGSAYPDWEEKKLGEIARITTGTSNRIDSILDGEYAFFDRSQEIRTSNIYLFDGEAIIMAGEGQEFIPKYFIGKFDLHQRAYAIMNLVDVHGLYVYYYIFENRNYFSRYAVGSTVKSLRLDTFEKMRVKLPCLDEQHQIADFLLSIDDKIVLLTKQIESTEQYKKGLLQQLFV